MRHITPGDSRQQANLLPDTLDYYVGEVHPIRWSMPSWTCKNQNLLQERAETGDAEAQWELYKRDKKVDGINNMKWSCRAADQGHYWARMELGQLYQDGIIIKQSLSRAYLWYALAAQTGQFYAADKFFRIA